MHRRANTLTRTIAVAAAAAVAAAVVASGIVVGFGAGSASAQTQAELCEPGANGVSPAGSIAAPAQDARFAVPTLTVEGEFHYERDVLGRPNGETTVEISIVACGKDQVLPEGSTWTKKESGPSIQFAWQTPGLPWNGPYAARVSVLSPAGNRQVTRTFAIVVPPAVPGDVHAAQAGDGVNVNWARSNEPDLIGYVVQRAAPSGPFERIAQVPAAKGVARPSVLDHPPAGDWRYNVVALRKGATDGEGLASDPSGPVTASFTPPPPTTTDGGDGGVGQPPGGTPATTPPDSATNAAIAKAGKVDLSGFSALLDQRARAAQRARPEEPDTGFQETLPFQPGDQPALADGDQEAGAGTTQGEGQRIVSDDSDRRRAMASLAAAFLLFVMFMQVRWVRTELEESDLEATEPGDESPAAGTQAVPDVADVRDAQDEPAPTTGEDATEQGSDAPELDVAGAPFRTRRRRELGQGETASTPRSASATRASRRLPPRPSDDRGEGAAPVRARGRRAGGRDGRLPVG